MIKKLTMKLRKTTSGGVFHDSRGDVKELMKVCNELINKVNELTDEVNRLSKIVERSGHK